MTPAHPVQSGIHGACPRCSARTLFSGFVKFAEKCPACGLDYSRFNVGDGPVVFMTMGIGAIITILAVTVELRWSPGFLVHMLLWIPLTTALVLLALRFGKGVLLNLEYSNAAREGRIKSE